MQYYKIVGYKKSKNRYVVLVQMYIFYQVNDTGCMLYNKVSQVYWAVTSESVSLLFFFDTNIMFKLGNNI